MSDHTPDPFRAQTGYDEDAADFDDVDFELEDADDELDVEAERAREH